MIYFDKSINGFLDSRIHVIPEWAIEITEKEREVLLLGECKFKKISSDSNGAPILIDLPVDVVAVSELLEIEKNRMRTIRVPILDALTGIAGRSARAGKSDIAAEADEVAEQLLMITDDPTLNSASTSEDMSKAADSAFQRIRDQVSDILKTAFKSVT